MYRLKEQRNLGAVIPPKFGVPWLIPKIKSSRNLAMTATLALMTVVTPGALLHLRHLRLRPVHLPDSILCPSPSRWKKLRHPGTVDVAEGRKSKKREIHCLF